MRCNGCERVFEAQRGKNDFEVPILHPTRVLTNTLSFRCPHCYCLHDAAGKGLFNNGYPCYFENGFVKVFYRNIRQKEIVDGVELNDDKPKKMAK